MNELKKYIYIMLLIAIITAAAGCTGKQAPPSLVTPTATETPTVTEIVKNSTANLSTTVSTGTNKTVIKCELCHTDPQTYTPHVNGGKLCINCHGSQVHNIHIGEGTVGLDCRTCHGFPPTIPTVLKGNGTGPGSYSVCERCHAPPPNSTQPSYGNIIIVHLSRGKYCTNCHGMDIAAIHSKALERMFNRTDIKTVVNGTIVNITNTTE